MCKQGAKLADAIGSGIPVTTSVPPATLARFDPAIHYLAWDTPYRPYLVDNRHATSSVHFDDLETYHPEMPPDPPEPQPIGRYRIDLGRFRRALERLTAAHRLLFEGRPVGFLDPELTASVLMARYRGGSRREGWFPAPGADSYQPSSFDQEFSDGVAARLVDVALDIQRVFLESAPAFRSGAGQPTAAVRLAAQVVIEIYELVGANRAAENGFFDDPTIERLHPWYVDTRSCWTAGPGRWRCSTSG